MTMFCHTCWNLLECCTCESAARAVHPTAHETPTIRWDPGCVWVRLDGGQVVPMTIDDLTDIWLAVAEHDCRQAANR